MPIDANIAMGYRPARIEPQANAFERSIRLQGLQRQNALGELQAQEAQAGLNERAAARQVMTQPGFDINNQEHFNKLQGVAPAQADSLLKSHLERVKTKGEADYKAAQTKGLTQDQAHKAVTFNLQALGGVNDPQAAAQWTMQGAQSGLLTPEQAQQAIAQIPTDQAGFAQWKQRQMMSGVELAKQFDIAAGAARDKETGRHNLSSEALTGRGQDLTASSAAAGRAVTMRGQNMTDARSLESNTNSFSKPFEVTNPADGKPMLVRQDKQGNITPVEGYAPKAAADKPLNDAQSKAALFGARMESSDLIIRALAEKGAEVSIPGSRSGFGVGAAINAISPEAKQQLDQAKRNFINATLRRESGAVISEGEFDNAEKQYFPQVGDGAKVKAQKAQNRAEATRGIQAEVPKSSRGVIGEIRGVPGDIHSQAESILKGGK